MSVPAADGTMLQAWLHRGKDGSITQGSQVQFIEDTGNGYRPLVAYRVLSLMQAAQVRRSLTLHDGDPGLTIEQHWLLALLDWIQLSMEWSVDIDTKRESRG